MTTRDMTQAQFLRECAECGQIGCFHDGRDRN